MSTAASIVPDVPVPASSTSTSHPAELPSIQAEDPHDPLTSSDPYVYLASRAFHQTFSCPRTQTRVSYVDCGDKTGPLLLYILPSGCSRWVAVFLDGYARAKGVRLVAADRPGQGRTARVPLPSRIETSTSQTLSLLEHLQLGGTEVSFLIHSAGIFFLLPVLLHLLKSPSPALPTLSGGIFLSSPWIPASVSGSRLFALVPASIATAGHLFIPKLLGSVNWLSGMSDGMGDSLKSVLAISGISVGARPVVTEQDQRKLDKANKKERAKSIRAHPTADIHPPFELQAEVLLGSPRMGAWIAEHGTEKGKKPNLDLGQELLFSYMMEEGCWGFSQEHSLCLGGGDPEGERGLVKALQGGWEDVGLTWKAKMMEAGEGEGKALLVVNYWACEDGLIPLKGRNWFDTLITQTPGILYERHELGAGAGHDTPISTKDVVDGIFSWVSVHG
ncbi:hypothetical protein FIBSPDRAFT_966832 [Athelia psychrophila]|uniref:Alpha/beta-hydrolase n=1 Tax=Athelia psychrophila TaxID=1759441 RepID=A0A167WCZ6_9AGAM|nr:hypothetical protein FIBSPDRAFT_966832 [Fibularhizoctonia sp. CBS 109695]